MRARFKYEEVEYDRKESGKWALISIGLMVVALYLAFLTFMCWFVSMWQFGALVAVLLITLISAVFAFRKIQMIEIDENEKWHKAYPTMSLNSYTVSTMPIHYMQRGNMLFIWHGSNKYIIEINKEQTND